MEDSDPKSQAAPEPDLEEAFARWDRKRDVEDHGLDPFVDLRLGEKPAEALAKARRGAQIRLLMTAVLVLFGLVTLAYNLDDFRFFFYDEEDIQDWGDLRARWRDGERPDDGKWPAMEHNTWVRFQNAIMTSERQTETKGKNVFFFFDPMTKTVIITRRALPDKSMRAMKYGEMHQSFTELQQGRWLRPVDLSAGFSGQGRLYRASSAPKYWRRVVDLYRQDMETRTALGLKEGPPSDFWVLVDGATPRDADLWRHVIIMLCAIGVMLLSLLFWLRARRRVRRLEESLGLNADPGIASA